MDVLGIGENIALGSAGPRPESMEQYQNDFDPDWIHVNGMQDKR